MIHDVDESLRALIRRDALAGTDVEVLLDAPTREWSARRNSPTLDMYLYDIREDLRRRENGLIDVLDDDGHVKERRRPTPLLQTFLPRHRLDAAARGRAFLAFCGTALPAPPRLLAEGRLGREPRRADRAHTGDGRLAATRGPGAV